IIFEGIKKAEPSSITEEANFPNPSDNEEYLLIAIYLNPEMFICFSKKL
ncbi:11874_t:CDS:2, partial [Funneliformis mosseae]